MKDNTVVELTEHEEMMRTYKARKYTCATDEEVVKNFSAYISHAMGEYGADCMTTWTAICRLADNIAKIGSAVQVVNDRNKKRKEDA